MQTDRQWRSIKEVIQDVSQEQWPDAGIQRLLYGVVAVTGASAGKLYLLSLRDSCYRAEFEALRENSAGKVDFPNEVALSELEVMSVIHPVIAGLRSDHALFLPASPGERGSEPASTSSLMSVPVMRNGSSLGTLFLEGAVGKQFDERDMHTAETAVAIVIMLLEKRTSLALMTNVVQEIDFSQPIRGFLDDLLTLVWAASGMKYVALREHQPGEKTLRCLNALGFSESEPTEFSLTPIEDYPTFYRAIVELTTQAEPSMDAPHLANLKRRQELQPIKSFVVSPIRVGKTVFGTLSFGADCEYNYSPLELAGFETIANSIGVAIANYRNAEHVHEVFAQTAKVAISFTALEVAQSARHEARGSLDNAQSFAALLLTKIPLVKGEVRDTLTKVITDLGKSLSAINSALDKVRDASLLPKMEMRVVSLRQLWQEAIVIVAGKMTSENVRHDITGDAEVSAYPDVLCLAFLNLILNSLDAFHEFAKKSGRKITINIDARAEEAQHLKIRYHDNASGIEPSRLKLPEGVKRSQPVKDLIFELGVSSKEQGSGYGLYLVRRILDMHGGSIDLVDFRGGVTFDLTLPKNQSLAAQAAKA
jgi:signal transduction histidine kinase